MSLGGELKVSWRATSGLWQHWCIFPSIGCNMLLYDGWVWKETRGIFGLNMRQILKWAWVTSVMSAPWA